MLHRSSRSIHYSKISGSLTRLKREFVRGRWRIVIVLVLLLLVHLTWGFEEEDEKEHERDEQFAGWLLTVRRLTTLRQNRAQLIKVEWLC